MSSRITSMHLHYGKYNESLPEEQVKMRAGLKRNSSETRFYLMK